MEHETFFTLLTDAAHWEFELFVEFITTAALLALSSPYIKKIFRIQKKEDLRLAALEKRMNDLEGTPTV